MTSESLYAIQQIRDAILQDSDLWSGYAIAPAYLDPVNGFINYRPDDSRNEWSAVEPSDKLGCWFYIRHQERQNMTFQQGELLTARQSQLIQRIPLRFVGVFTQMEYHEVIDRVINRIDYINTELQGTQFNSAHGFQTEIQNAYIDMVGMYPDETDNRYINYSQNFQTIGIDFNLSFIREATKCRPFTNLVP